MTRRAFLAKVEAILGTLPVEVEVTYKELETAPEAPPLGPRPGVRGLVVRSPSALPSVVGVSGTHGASSRVWRRAGASTIGPEPTTAQSSWRRADSGRGWSCTESN